jgi:hypothetical protein
MLRVANHTGPHVPPPCHALLAALLLTLGAWPAAAGVTRCWIDQGVVVVPAMVAGVAGDYILDTGARATQIHETRAQAEGLGAGPMSAEVRIAGLRLPARPVTVVDLDARTSAFPTPIAGVIGADILAGRVLDVRFAPCRVGLWPKGREPRWSGGVALPLRLSDGRPLVAAGVADDVRAALGLFVPATGLDAAVRMATDKATAIHGGQPERLLPYGAGRARLRAFSFAGELWEELPTGLTPPAELPPEALGEIGPQVLAGWRLRFDLGGGRLWLAPRR